MVVVMRTGKNVSEETVTEGQEALPSVIVKQHCARCRLLYEADMKNH
ncbi:MAG: Uncharacterised protein [Synechococcus sp. MIT S9220]|nr:MAG: Uncharacterised protein [Synechococcus sp. MIT S9220]